MALILSSPAAVAEEQIWMNTRMYDTNSQKLVSKGEHRGGVNKIFQDQKRLMFSLLEQAGIKKSSLPPEVVKKLETLQTTSIEALAAFSVGLDMLDKGKFQEAKAAFELASSLDNSFEAAKQYGESTPRFNQGLQQVLLIAERNGSQQSSQLLNSGSATAFTTPTPELPGGGSTTDSGGSSGDGEAATLEALIEQTTAKVEEKVAADAAKIAQEITEAVKNDPDSAAEIMENAVLDGSTTTENAMEAALKGLAGSGNSAEVKAVVETALETGITKEGAQEVMDEIRATTSCL